MAYGPDDYEVADAVISCDICVFPGECQDPVVEMQSELDSIVDGAVVGHVDWGPTSAVAPPVVLPGGTIALAGRTLDESNSGQIWNGRWRFVRLPRKCPGVLTVSVRLWDYTEVDPVLVSSDDVVFEFASEDGPSRGDWNDIEAPEDNNFVVQVVWTWEPEP